MYIFAEKLIKVEGARENFYKLLVNGKCLIDEFWNKIQKEGNYEDDLDKIQVIIEKMSRGEPTPQKLFKELKGRKKSDHTKDYEIIVKKIRVYLFKCEKTGKIIVLGALKDPKGQQSDIDRMRRIKVAYIQSKGR
ncbi:MAG: hypothetical protein NTU98_10555 [Bacteroidetes bacterium]|nr:hypothetical protein [Bacteroidota bacterium]